MVSIGIVVNPFSGKDLRRITSAAVNVSNAEKADKVVRMIRGMESFGIDKVLLLPDNYMMGPYIAESAGKYKNLPAVEILDYTPEDNCNDTLEGLRRMTEIGIQCLIVLGGDGTCRLAAKAGVRVPIIPISTGTNNVYPEFWEGTTVGIAAAYCATHSFSDVVAHRSKQIEIWLNGELSDVALVDAAVTKVPYIGSKVVPNADEIEEVVVCKCGPELIGLSALIGSAAVCDDKDDYGYGMSLSDKRYAAITTMNPGQLTVVVHGEPYRMEFGRKKSFRASFNGTIALDGERTVCFSEGTLIEFKIERNGPWRLDIPQTLRKAVKEGFLERQLEQSCCARQESHIR